MTAKRDRRWAYGLLALAVTYVVAVYLIPGFLDSSDGEAGSGLCIQKQEAGLDHGEHLGRRWRVDASVEKIESSGRCSYWFLKVKFTPQGIERGSWTMGWGIIAGGHLPARATIDAGDHEEEDGRAVGGVVGSRVRSVVLELSGGRTMVVHPKVPGRGLRKRFVWLRDLRYFFRLYPAGEHVKTAKILDADGRVLFTARSQEGELHGYMVG